MPALNPRQTSIVEVVVKPDIEADQIAELVRQIGGLVSCRTCGLGGIDLRLRAEDPEVLDLGDKIAGVSSAVVSVP